MSNGTKVALASILAMVTVFCYAVAGIVSIGTPLLIFYILYRLATSL